MIFGEPLWLLNTDHQEVDFAAQASFDSFLEQQLGVGPGGIPVLAQELKEREESSESAVTSACGYVFHQNDFVYHCKTCEADPTCCICKACFEHSDHAGHDYTVYRSQGGGCCDCGDEEAWDPQGCCPKHRPKRRRVKTDDPAESWEEERETELKVLACLPGSNADKKLLINGVSRLLRYVFETVVEANETLLRNFPEEYTSVDVRPLDSDDALGQSPSLPVVAEPWLDAIRLMAQTASTYDEQEAGDNRKKAVMTKEGLDNLRHCPNLFRRVINYVVQANKGANLSKEKRSFVIVVHNDDFNTYDHVMTTFAQVFPRYSALEIQRLTSEIDKKGHAVLKAFVLPPDFSGPIELLSRYCRGYQKALKLATAIADAGLQTSIDIADFAERMEKSTKMVKAIRDLCTSSLAMGCIASTTDKTIVSHYSLQLLSKVPSPGIQVSDTGRATLLERNDMHMPPNTVIRSVIEAPNAWSYLIGRAHDAIAPLNMALYDFYMTFIKLPIARRRLSSAVLCAYQTMHDAFVAGAPTGSNHGLDLAVQIYTVPSLTSTLARNYRGLAVLVRCLKSAMDRANGPLKVDLEDNVFNHQRYNHSLMGMEYMLRCTEGAQAFIEDQSSFRSAVESLCTVEKFDWTVRRHSGLVYHDELESSWLNAYEFVVRGARVVHAILNDLTECVFSSLPPTKHHIGAIGLIASSLRRQTREEAPELYLELPGWKRLVKGYRLNLLTQHGYMMVPRPRLLAGCVDHFLSHCHGSLTVDGRKFYSLSELIHYAFEYYEQEASDSSVTITEDAFELPLALADSSLTAMAFASHISSNLWIRNGHSLRDQAHNYLGVGLSAVMRDLDVKMLQMLGSMVDADVFVANVVSRYGIQRYLKNLQGKGINGDEDPDTVYVSVEPSPGVKVENVDVSLTEKAGDIAIGMLAMFVATTSSSGSICERDTTPEDYKDSLERSIVRAEVVHVLAAEDCPFSVIERQASLSAAGSSSSIGASSVEEAVESVATKVPGSKPTKFRIKEEVLLREYDHGFLHQRREAYEPSREAWLRAYKTHISKVIGREYRKENWHVVATNTNKLLPAVPVPGGLHSWLEPIRRILTADFLLDIVAGFLFRMDREGGVIEGESPVDVKEQANMYCLVLLSQAVHFACGDGKRYGVTWELLLSRLEEPRIQERLCILDLLMNCIRGLDSIGNDEVSLILIWLVGKIAELAPRFRDRLEAHIQTVVGQARGEDRESQRSKKLQKRQAAQKKALEAMKARSAAFAEKHKEKKTAEEESSEEWFDELPQCIVCRENSPKEQIGYLGHVTEALPWHSSQLRRGMKQYNLDGSERVPTRRFETLPPQLRSLKHPGEIIEVDEGGDAISERFSSRSPLRLRFCGHCMHKVCYDALLAAANDQNGERFDGRFVCSPAEQEVLCPLCKSVCNILVPLPISQLSPEEGQDLKAVLRESAGEQDSAMDEEEHDGAGRRREKAALVQEKAGASAALVEERSADESLRPFIMARKSVCLDYAITLVDRLRKRYREYHAVDDRLPISFAETISALRFSIALSMTKLNSVSAEESSLGVAMSIGQRQGIGATLGLVKSYKYGFNDPTLFRSCIVDPLLALIYGWDSSDKRQQSGLNLPLPSSLLRSDIPYFLLASIVLPDPEGLIEGFKSTARYLFLASLLQSVVFSAASPSEECVLQDDPLDFESVEIEDGETECVKSIALLVRSTMGLAMIASPETPGEWQSFAQIVKGRAISFLQFALIARQILRESAPTMGEGAKTAKFNASDLSYQSFYTLDCNELLQCFSLPKFSRLHEVFGGEIQPLVRRWLSRLPEKKASGGAIAAKDSREHDGGQSADEEAMDEDDEYITASPSPLSNGESAPVAMAHGLHLSEALSSLHVSPFGGCSPLLPPPPVAFPLQFESLFEAVRERACLRCKTVQKHRAICLLCGDLVCSGTECCRSSGGECTTHAENCGNGIGVFFMLKRGGILLVNGSFACYYGSIYVDKYGEEDLDQRRGKPLFLSKDKVEQLEKMIWTSRVREIVTAERLKGDSVIRSRFF